MKACEYSEAEHKLFRHFKTEELCEWIFPVQLYRETVIKAFCYPGYNSHYEQALRTAFSLVDYIDRSNRGYRMTPEFDEAINFWMDRAEGD